MAESKIIGLIVAVWKAVVGLYEASFLARAVDGICSFFRKNADGSAAVRIFRHGVFGGEWWKNSLAYRAMCLPIAGRKKYIGGRSRILETVINITDVPLVSVGIIIAAYTAALAVGMLLFGNVDMINTAVVAALAVVAVICVILRRSCRSLFLGSRVCGFVASLFYDGEVKDVAERNIPCKVTALIAALFGVATGAVSPAAVTLAFVSIIAVAAVVARFEIGVFATLFLAAFLPTSAVAGLGVLTVIGFAAALFEGRINNLKPTAIAPLLAIYVLLGAFSTATSFDVKSSAFIYVVYLVFIAMYAVIANTLTTPSKWRAGVAVFAFGAIFIAALGIWQNFTMDATTQSWVDAQMFEDIKIRVYATFDNPNVLGQYFIIVMPVIFSLFVLTEKLPQKTVWLAIFAVSFLCLLYTWSRGAWVGVVLGVSVFLLVRDRRWIVLGVLALLAMPFVLPDSIMNRLLSIGNTGDSSTAYRVSVWIASARMALDYWMSGVGYGSDAFAAVYSGYALNGAGYALHSHNFYIQLIADVGIGGLIAYVLIVWTAYREISSVRNNYMIKTVCFALGAALVGYLFQGVAESLWYNMRMSLMFWIVMAFITSGARLDKEESTV